MALTLLQMQAQFGADPMRSAIVDLLWQSSRVMNLLYFIPHTGFSYPYSQRTKLPGVAFRAMNSTFTPTAGVTNPAVESLSILGGKIRTDSIVEEVKGPATRSNEIAAQIEAAAKFFDKNFFNGDPRTNPLAFLGLRGRLAGTQRLKNAANGAPVSNKAVTKLLDAVEGDNSQKVLFMNQTVRRDLSADVVANASGSGVMDQGAQLQSFQRAKIVEIYYDEAEQPIMPFSEACGTSGNVCSSIYCVKFGGQIDERGVQGITGLKDKIKVSGPFDYGEFKEDVVQMVAGIGVFGGYVAARLEGITANS